MSRNPGDRSDGAQHAASQLLARAAVDDVRARHRLEGARHDFFLSDTARLDDRTRAALGAALSAHVGAVEQALRRHASQVLTAQAHPLIGTVLAQGPPRVEAVLRYARQLDHGGLVAELLARAQQEALDHAMPPPESTADAPAFLTRMAAHPDALIAAAAKALQRADAGRRRAREAGQVCAHDLSAEFQHQLVWQAAAALRTSFSAPDPAANAALDRALTEAALRSLAGHDEGERLEAVALRLAAALDPCADELPELAAMALHETGMVLFCALLAHGLGLAYEHVREMVLDPVADRLWLALRVLEFDRGSIARIGLALCSADPRRDEEAFADAIGAVMAVTPQAARGALARTLLHPDFREAVLALAQSRPQ